MRQVVCSCGAVNRLPEGRDPKAAKCGQCGQGLFAGRPLEVTGAEFEKHRASTRGVPLVVDVWAPWCGPCRAMAPQFATAAAQLEPEAQLLKLNSDAAPEAAAALGVSSIPALFVIADGRIVARRAGAMPAAQIEAWARQVLASVKT